MSEEDLQQAVAAIGHATRRGALGLLARAGEAGMLPSELADALRLPRNLMSAHLSVLIRGGLIARDAPTGDDADGRTAVLRLRPERLDELGRHLVAMARAAGAPGGRR